MFVFDFFAHNPELDIYELSRDALKLATCHSQLAS